MKALAAVLGMLLALVLSCSREPEAPKPGAAADFFPAALDKATGEQFDLAAIQVEYVITQIAERIRYRAATDVVAQFADDFQGVPPLSPPATLPEFKKREPLGIEIASTKEVETASKSTVRESVEAFLKAVPVVTGARMKMPLMKFWERGVFGTLRLEVNGERTDGGPVTLQEQFDAVLVLRDKKWQIQKLRRVSRREVRAAAPAAREIASAAGLVGNPESGAAVGTEPYTAWRGAAAGDLDGDGWLDLVLVSPFEVRVFKNAQGRFQEMKETGIVFGSPASGALMFDSDGDGDLDVAVSQFVWARAALNQPDARSLVLWRNEGGFRFTNVTKAAGLASKGPATSLAAADIDLDGDLDLYQCMYGGDDPENMTPHPLLQARNGQANLLFVNQGNGTFVERGKELGIADTGWSLAVAFGDVDGDRYPDLYVANDFGPHRFYRNRKGKFEEISGDQGFGMGVSWGDYDNDGDLDAYVSNMYSNAGKRVLASEQQNLKDEVFSMLRKSAEGNTLLRNDGGKLVDVTAEAGVGPGGWAWCNTFLDLDNDGRQDLYVVNGYLSGLTKRDR